MTPASHTDGAASRYGQAPYKRAQLFEAIRVLESAGQRDPDGGERHSLADRRVAISEAYFRLAILPGTELPDSLTYIQQAIEYDPFHPKLFFHLGRLLHRAGDYQGAVQSYREALRHAPTSHRAYVHLAIALLELEENEKTLGRSILETLMRGDEAKLPGHLAEVDESIRAQRSAAAGKRRQPAARPNSPQGQSGPGAPANATSCRWQGVWRLSLVELLSRQKFIRKQIDKQLEAGANFLKDDRGVAEYAVACLFLLLCGETLKETAKEVSRLLEGGAAKRHAGHAAVRLVTETAALTAVEAPEEFAARAAEALQAEVLPAELVCYLHYAKYGPQHSRAIDESLRLLDAYPERLRQHDCFRELRIAVLEGYARRAWGNERFEQAKLLWRETIPLDPNRIAVAHNLALAAARTRSRDDYNSAWERSFELRYLYAAAAGDVQVLLEERRVMHLSFVQQSERRYQDFSKAANTDQQKRENIEAWLADRDAFTTWLREWDLYYLNSRLRFRSPVHLLGVPRDATAETVAEARDSLLRHIDLSLRTQPWGGIKTFCELADRLVNRAAEQADDLVARARDPYYEEEKAEADALTQETLKRGFLLGQDVLTSLAAGSEAQKLAVAAAVGRRLFSLPWKILQPSCVARGWIPYDLDLTTYFEDRFLRAVHAAQNEPRSEREAAQMLSALDDYIRILPHRVELRPARCKLLLSSKKNEAAYTSAIDALPLVAQVEEEDVAESFEAVLLNLADKAAHEEMPQRIKSILDSRGGMTEAHAEAVLREGHAVLERFARAGGFRLYLCKLHLQLGGVRHVAEATRLLKQGLELALTDTQRREFLDLLGKANSAEKTAFVVEEVRKLLDGASQRANETVEAVKEDASPESLRKGLEVIEGAIRDARRAAEVAAGAGLHEAKAQAEKLLRQLSGVEQRLRQLQRG